MIHLDANATSTLRVSARKAAEEVLKDSLGNPSSIYQAGRSSRTILTRARRRVLKSCLGERSRDASAQVFFTSGGTEGCNTLVHGFVNPSGGNVVTSSIEHPAMLLPIRSLNGVQVREVDPGRDGILSVEQVFAAVSKETMLVSIMAANNESGALQPVAEIARALRQSGYSGAIISDITQAFLKSNLSVWELFSAGVNGVTFSGHKLGALSGVGAVVIAGGEFGLCLPFSPLLLGGGQENGFRSGTENIIGVASLAAALEELEECGAEERSRVRTLRDRLWRKLSRTIAPVFRLTPEDGLGNTLLLRIPGCRTDDLVVSLDLRGINVSRGSACSSGKQRPSHVLFSMGLTLEEAREVIRISLDWTITEELLDAAAFHIVEAVRDMRSALSSEAA